MPTELQHTPALSVNEVRNVAVDFTGKLDAGELLTGNPTIEEVGTAFMTFTSEVVNTEAIEVNGRTLAPGQAVQFTVDVDATATGKTLKVDATVDTDKGQTVDIRLPFMVR